MSYSDFVTIERYEKVPKVYSREMQNSLKYGYELI